MQALWGRAGLGAEHRVTSSSSLLGVSLPGHQNGISWSVALSHPAGRHVLRIGYGSLELGVRAQ